MSTHRQRVLQPNDNMLTFPALSSPLLFHGVFNRFGGVSPAPWDSKNVSLGLGDSPENVQSNRAQIKNSLGCEHLISAKQVHDSSVYIVDENPEEDSEVEGFDALITDKPGVGLMIQQADCQAVFFFDPENKAIGIAHVGWKGTVADIIAETVSAMSRAFATEPANLIATISPSLGPCCAEFIHYRSELPVSLHGYQVRPNYFDFWAISRDQLCSAGVKPKNIHVAETCTC